MMDETTLLDGMRYYCAMIAFSAAVKAGRAEGLSVPLPIRSQFKGFGRFCRDAASA